MKFIKKYWLFIVILAAGIIIRLINLDKPAGLWYDEMTIYSIASQKGIAGMLSLDSHRFLMFPLYYLIYKAWITVFGNSDFIIRLMSVCFDVLAIAAAYFVGKQTAISIDKADKKEQLGLINMLFYAINASFIYYAQEAKFYSLSFLFVNLLILYWLKILNIRHSALDTESNQSDLKNSVIFIIINFLLLYTYTSQALLIIVLMSVTTCYWLINRCFKSNLKLLAFWSVVFVPLILLIIFYQNYYSGNFDAVVFDSSFILLLVQNWFSPLLVGLQNNVLEYFKYIPGFMFDAKMWFFLFVPVIFSLSFIIKSVKENCLARYIIAVPLAFVSIHILLFNLISYSPLVRYTLTALPFAILCMSIGFVNYKRKGFKISLICIIILANLLCLFTQYGAVSIKRPDGYRLLADNLIRNEVSSDYDFILPIRPQLIDKYFDINGNKYSLYDLNNIDAQKTYLLSDEITYINRKENLHKNYQRYLLAKDVTRKFDQYVTERYLKNSKKGIVVLVDKSISMFDNFDLAEIVASQNYEKYPIQFLRMSKLTNDLLFVINRKMDIENYIQLNGWDIYVFQKRP